MNAYAHGTSCHGRRDRGPAVLVALLTVATLGSPAAVGDQISLPDGGVVISDGVVDQGLLPNDIDGLGGVAYGEENPTMQGMPQMPLAEYGPRWFVAVDALMLWQGNATRSPLLLDQEGATALDVGTMRTELSAGPRFSVIRSLGDCHAIEGNFFQVSPFHSTASAPATGVPYSVVGTVQLPFADIDSATAAGSGLIKSAELNWRHNNCCSPFTWLAGFRWVELNSQLNVDYAYTIPGDTPTFGTGSLDMQSGNNLYGGQAGFDVRLWNKGGSWRVNGIGKAGLFANADAYQRSTAAFVTDGEPPVSLGTVAASANQVAFFGEAGLNATYCITHWLAWRAGYTVFWANGVAVAAQQLPNNNFGAGTATIDTTGSMMLHGVNTGFEARW